MIVLFVLAALAPALTAVGIIFWAKWIRADPASGTVARGVAIGFAAGIILGVGVGAALIGLAIGLARALGR
jgi:hypothetical protein